MIDKKKNFIKKNLCVLFVFYVPLLSGCDQIKNRLLNSSENNSKYEDDNVDHNNDLKAEKVDDQKLNSSEDTPIPIIEHIDQNIDTQYKLIKENSKKTVNEESYSIIGTERGKPFRDNTSGRIKND